MILRKRYLFGLKITQLNNHHEKWEIISLQCINEKIVLRAYCFHQIYIFSIFSIFNIVFCMITRL